MGESGVKEAGVHLGQEVYESILHSRAEVGPRELAGHSQLLRGNRGRGGRKYSTFDANFHSHVDDVGPMLKLIDKTNPRYWCD